MSCIHAAVYFLNMIYVLCYYLIAVVRVTVATLWCTFALIGAGIPWLLAAATAIWCVGQVAQLHRPRATATMSAALQRLMRTGSDAAADEDGVATNKATAVSTGSSLYWPVASRGAALDAPENSMAALRMCREKSCQMVLLDLTISKSGELVIVSGGNRTTTTANGGSDMQCDNIKSDSVWRGQFPDEPVLTLAELLRQLPELDHTTTSSSVGSDQMTVFLLLTSPAKPTVDALRPVLLAHQALFRQRICICSDSLYTLHLVRQQCGLDTVCALWLGAVQPHRPAASPAPLPAAALGRRLLRWATPSPLVAMLRSGMRWLAPLAGISVVFVPKDEFSASQRRAWLAAGVRPIVYPVNTPNEKLYYQRLRTHYVTGSLRTEPQHLLGGK